MDDRKDKKHILHNILHISYDDMPRMPYIEIYDSDKHCLARTNNVLTFAWVQYQIILHRCDGCYVIHDGHRYDIDSNDGTIHSAPRELFPYDIIDELRTNAAYDNYIRNGIGGPDVMLAESLVDKDVMQE